MEKDSLFQGESKNVEYKEMVPKNSHKYMKSVVAFANGEGGRVILALKTELCGSLVFPRPTSFD